VFGKIHDPSATLDLFVEPLQHVRILVFIWDDGGKRHGIPEFPMDWKFSLKLPDGFHFDVSRNVKSKNKFKDKHERQHEFERYINVTAHGEVRGAR